VSVNKQDSYGICHITLLPWKHNSESCLYRYATYVDFNNVNIESFVIETQQHIPFSIVVEL
jgi:hypothetical protein